MAATALPGARPPSRIAPNVRLSAVVLLFGFVASGTVRAMATGIWQLDDHAFEPVILVIAVAMAVTIFRRAAPTDRSAGWGMAVILAGALALTAGVLLNNITARVTGLWVLALGLTLYLSGPATVRRNTYPFVVSLFAIPLPGSALTAITFPMKLQISSLATGALRLLNFPVANEGVLIEIGDYRLLVADACSGVQSMFSLLSVALVYLFLARVDRVPRAVLLVLLAVPIVFVLNVLRVVVLALITYWFGNAAGEGFLHGIAGFAMFVGAFFLLMAIDRPLERLWPRSTG